ncbi:MAG: peptidyl-prolyl cis-trans isomerase [Gammaproteobacteria bacterium]|jgi:peptidyl-prolyl cis-trans isomerase B (cyclophilin B)|nr:peptidyl-prolyl cis-trans isomerase [Gammaproteobacteria bacterium]
MDEKRVVIHTSLGPITLELYPQHAPRTVANFLAYVRDHFYDNTVFHRVVDGFIIQGGGFQPGMVQKNTRPPIRNEAENGLRNESGTIAMARLPEDPHSATAQFFFNTVDNGGLNHRDATDEGWGYCVFGRIVSGTEILERIEGIPTISRGPHQNVPLKDVLIQLVEELN